MILSPAEVTAIVVTRGDVDLVPVLEPLIFSRVAIWNNADPREPDLGAFGRYKAIERTDTPVVYFQDDDCVVSPEAQRALLAAYEDGLFVSNMDPNHNGGSYPLLALPGWGSLVRRDLPERAFSRWQEAHPDDYGSDDFLRIGCDIVFPVLTPSLMIDLGHMNLPHAYADNRTWRQDGYTGKKDWYYREAAKLRG